jgi:hypothetical protein
VELRSSPVSNPNFQMPVFVNGILLCDYAPATAPLRAVDPGAKNAPWPFYRVVAR